MDLDKIGTDMPVLYYDRLIEQFSDQEKEIQCLRMLAISARVAAFMTEYADLALVRHSGLSDLSE
jgi:hypothetical protein